MAEEAARPARARVRVPPVGGSCAPRGVQLHAPRGQAYVEPATNITATTVVLIAHDGEWTRRALPSRPVAFEVARGLDVPVYDVNLRGYPARMREWTARQRRPKGR